MKDKQLKPSKTCGVCDWHNDYICGDCEREQGGSGLHYNDYNYLYD